MYVSGAPRPLENNQEYRFFSNEYAMLSFFSLALVGKVEFAVFRESSQDSEEVGIGNGLWLVAIHQGHSCLSGIARLTPEAASRPFQYQIQFPYLQNTFPASK